MLLSVVPVSPERLEPVPYRQQGEDRQTEERWQHEQPDENVDKVHRCIIVQDYIVHDYAS
jgi:hypothetical protein